MNEEAFDIHEKAILRLAINSLRINVKVRIAERYYLKKLFRKFRVNLSGPKRSFETPKVSNRHSLDIQSEQIISKVPKSSALKLEYLLSDNITFSPKNH